MNRYQKMINDELGETIDNNKEFSYAIKIKCRMKKFIDSYESKIRKANEKSLGFIIVDIRKEELKKMKQAYSCLAKKVNQYITDHIDDPDILMELWNSGSGQK